MENSAKEQIELNDSSRGEVVFDEQQLFPPVTENNAIHDIREPEAEFLQGDSYPGRSLFERR